jgi:hypothetical protein
MKTPSDLPVPECPTQAEAGAMLAKEMNKLSVEEREKVLADIHGISPVVDEPQEFIEASLALLEKAIFPAKQPTIWPAPCRRNTLRATK